MENAIGLSVWCDGFVNGELCMGIVLIVCVYGVIEWKWWMVCIVWMYGVMVCKWGMFYIVCVYGVMVCKWGMMYGKLGIAHGENGSL